MALRTMNSLYTLCLSETALLLIRRYWDPDMTISPFRVFPPNIVHDLISCVCIKTPQYLRSSYIRLLLTSDRVTKLEIQNVKLNAANAHGIFNALSMPFSRKLKVIKLINIDATFRYNIRNSISVRTSFGSLLRRARYLECLETCIKFKLESIVYCFYLQKLVLHFNLVNMITYSFVPYVPPLNHSLKVLNISPIFQIDGYIRYVIGTLLQYYVELVEMDYEVSRSILYLNERHIVRRFKLRKATLGNEVGAICWGIFMTSQYCPDLEEVTVTPINHVAIHYLGCFCHIASLTIYEPTIGNNNYNLGIHPLLKNQEFGPNLKSLKIIQYTGVSTSSIGSCCPNLEELRLELISEDSSLEIVPPAYKKLLSLFVETDGNREPCSAVTLIGCLSNAVDLEFLTIRNSSLLTDNVLERILENDEALTNVKTITIPLCGLSINGFRRLAPRLRAARRLVMNSDRIRREDVEWEIHLLDLSLSLQWTGP